MIWRIDRWFGTRIMHPPIVKLCQLTGLTQFAVSRYAWMLASFTLVMRMHGGSIANIVSATLITLCAVISTLLAALTPNWPGPPLTTIRKVILIIAVVDLIVALVDLQRTGSPQLGWGDAWDCLALVAEYAKTIRTIPPRRTREPRRKSIQQGP